jgi:hypothetical protein
MDKSHMSKQIKTMSKYTLKLGLFSIILLMTGAVEAQRGQRQGGHSQNRGGSQEAMPKFNSENAIGILTYDYEKVQKKTKLKKDDKQRSVEKIISDYNQIINEIKFLHSEEFKETESFVEMKKEEAKINRDRDAMDYIHTEAIKKLSRVKSKVLQAEQQLNNKLVIVFSEKQNNKWLRYQQTRKESLKPKRPESSDDRRPQQGGPRGR